MFARERWIYTGTEDFGERIGCWPRESRVSRICRSPNKKQASVSGGRPEGAGTVSVCGRDRFLELETYCGKAPGDKHVRNWNARRCRFLESRKSGGVIPKSWLGFHADGEVDQDSSRVKGQTDPTGDLFPSEV